MSAAGGSGNAIIGAMPGKWSVQRMAAAPMSLGMEYAYAFDKCAFGRF